MLEIYMVGTSMLKPSIYEPLTHSFNACYVISVHLPVIHSAVIGLNWQLLWRISWINDRCFQYLLLSSLELYCTVLEISQPIKFTVSLLVKNAQ